MRLASINTRLRPFLLPISLGFPNSVVCRTTQRYLATRTQLSHKYTKSSTLSTLDPKKLLLSDFRDIAKRFLPQIYFSDNPVPLKHRPQMFYWYSLGHLYPFPDHARGFFYYHAAVDNPLASSIRFRCTSSKDSASFSEGEDLLHPTGLPWQCSLKYITMRAPSLRDELLKTGMITNDQVSRIRHIFEENPAHPSLVLYRLDQLFSLKFHQVSLNLAAVVHDELLHFRIINLFNDTRIHPTKGNVYGQPYHGSALARFELSTLPEHSGHDTIVMRIVKFVDPPTCTIPNYDGYISAPVEGELVQRRKLPWHRCIGRTARVIQGLAH